MVGEHNSSVANVESRSRGGDPGQSLTSSTVRREIKDTPSRVDQYLSGLALYGDDFSESEIEQWFRDEAEGYFELEPGRRPGTYGYFALNWWHGFQHIPAGPLEHVLGFGSAFGDELAPVVARARKVTIVESSDGFRNPRFEYVKPNPGGALAFPDSSFDLISCLGVLHHVPNVSKVLKELARCLMPNGVALVREPIISMGDWRLPRRGLTKRERGIPLPIFRRLIDAAGLDVEREAKCMFSLTSRFKYLLREPVYNSATVVRLDSLLCQLPIWPKGYHPRVWLQKLKPTCVFYVLRKRRQALGSKICQVV